MKIAIIGAGISGLGAAYLLNPHHDITVFEHNDRIGGHSRTIDIDDNGKTIPVDTGFIVFNRRNYPLLDGLFRHLDVPVIESDMSFGASIGANGKPGWLEYGSKGLFAQKSNLFRPKFWGMLRDILRFNKTAARYINGHPDMTLAECLDDMKLGDWFRRYYLQPMGAAIWSCSIETILGFPASSFLQFFKNHGLLTIADHPQWYTVRGGSREYVRLLTAPFADKILTGHGVTKVERYPHGVRVHDAKGEIRDFDQAVFACPADIALKLIDAPTPDEHSILGAFTYQHNAVTVHRDTSFMPKARGAWASWAYLSEDRRDTAPSVSLTYWMNNLQKLESDRPILVTLNPGRRPRESDIVEDHAFRHPVFTVAAIAAQGRIDSIQGTNNLWFCGAYQRYGFHEDGLLSAVNIAKKLGIDPPWT